MKMKYLLLAVLLSGLLFASGSISAQAATIRGRIVHQNGYPAVGYTVTVSNPQLGRSNPARTGGDGMYYFFNIPPGFYYLEVWVNPGGAPLVFQIQVSDPNTDIPQVVVP
jgi:hypothetical protein